MRPNKQRTKTQKQNEKKKQRWNVVVDVPCLCQQKFPKRARWRETAWL